MPWGGGLLASNPYLYARYLGAQGYTYREIMRELRKTHTDGPGVSLVAAANAGVRWGAYIRDRQSNYADQKLDRGRSYFDSVAYASGNRLASAWQYGVIFEQFNVMTGETTYNTVFVNSNTSLTPEDIIREARQVYAAVSATYKRFQDWDISTEVNALVVTAQRRSR